MDPVFTKTREDDTGVYQQMTLEFNWEAYGSKIVQTNKEMNS